MAASLVLERNLKQHAGAQDAGVERRRVYIFLSRQGLLYGFTLVVMLLGAVNYTNSMAYLLTFLLASLFMVCMLNTYRNLRGLVVTPGDGEAIFAGDTVHFPILLDNRPGYARPGLNLKLRRGNRKKTDPLPTTVTDLDAGEMRRVVLEVPAARRGILSLDDVVLSTTFPLGLFRAWSYLDTAPVCIVYPRPVGRAPLPAPLEYESENQAGLRPGTDDFTGLRAYRPGDSMRSVDWKALAREQGPLVKRFVGAGSRKLVLHWDMTAGLDTEVRLSQLARWILDAEREGIHYGLEIPGATLAPASGAAHRDACLEALARYPG